MQAVIDGGGFGIGDASELSRQALAGVGYWMNERWSVQAGYRHLSVEKQLSAGDSTLELSGPYLGVTATFRAPETSSAVWVGEAPAAGGRRGNGARQESRAAR